MSWEGSAIFSILLRREVPKHVATKGHRIRPHDVISIQGFFYWIHLVVLLDVTVFFCNEKGVVGVHAHSICDALVRQKINGMYRIFLSGVSDFWKSFLFVSATKNLMYHIFFIRYIRFVLIRNLFLFEDPR